MTRRTSRKLRSNSRRHATPPWARIRKNSRRRSSLRRNGYFNASGLTYRDWHELAGKPEYSGPGAIAASESAKMHADWEKDVNPRGYKLRMNGRKLRSNRRRTSLRRHSRKLHSNRRRRHSRR